MAGIARGGCLQQVPILGAARLKGTRNIEASRGRLRQLRLLGHKRSDRLMANSIAEHVVGDAVDPGEYRFPLQQHGTLDPAVTPGILGDLLGSVGIDAFGH